MSKQIFDQIVLTLDILNMAFSHTTIVRVRYSETDRMGYVYYGAYAAYLEVGRVETLRALGVSYKALEDEGIMLPVGTLHLDYKRPAKYDDQVHIQTTITSLPSARIDFDYTLTLEDGTLLASGYTQLVFVDDPSRRPMRPPSNVLEALQPYF